MVYADSSAVLGWLFTEPGNERLAPWLRPPAPVVVSTLTLIECDRALYRLTQLPSSRDADIEGLRASFLELSAGWAIEPISAAVVSRARSSFPDDAIRSLDSIHLATAVVVRDAVGELDVLSLDERIRLNARSLGFKVRPD